MILQIYLHQHQLSGALSESQGIAGAFWSMHAHTLRCQSAGQQEAPNYTFDPCILIPEGQPLNWLGCALDAYLCLACNQRNLHNRFVFEHQNLTLLCACCYPADPI